MDLSLSPRGHRPCCPLLLQKPVSPNDGPQHETRLTSGGWARRCTSKARLPHMDHSSWITQLHPKAVNPCRHCWDHWSPSDTLNLLIENCCSEDSESLSLLKWAGKELRKGWFSCVQRHMQGPVSWRLRKHDRTGKLAQPTVGRKQVETQKLVYVEFSHLKAQCWRRKRAGHRTNFRITSHNTFNNWMGR